MCNREKEHFVAELKNIRLIPKLHRFYLFISSNRLVEQLSHADGNEIRSPAWKLLPRIVIYVCR